MNLPPDKVKILSQYDNDKKWDLICDQVGLRKTNARNISVLTGASIMHVSIATAGTIITVGKKRRPDSFTVSLKTNVSIHLSLTAVLSRFCERVSIKLVYVKDAVWLTLSLLSDLIRMCVCLHL